MWGGIQLPKRADLLTLPPPYRGPLSGLAKRMGQLVSLRPAPYRRSVNAVLEATEGFRCREVIGRWRIRAEHTPPQFRNFIRNTLPLMSARTGRLPALHTALRASLQITTVKRAKPAHANPKLGCPLGRCDTSVTIRCHHMADQARTMTPTQLMMFFFMAASYAMSSSQRTRTMPQPPFRSPPYQKGSFGARLRKFCRTGG